MLDFCIRFQIVLSANFDLAQKGGKKIEGKMDSLRKKLEVPPRTDTCVWRRSAEKIQSFAEGLVNFST